MKRCYCHSQAILIDIKGVREFFITYPVIENVITQLGDLNMRKTIITLAVTSVVLSGCSNMGPGEQTGTVLGGVTGAAVGSQFGHGGGSVVGAGGGGATGAIVGGAVGRSADDSNRYNYRQA